MTPVPSAIGSGQAGSQPSLTTDRSCCELGSCCSYPYKHSVTLVANLASVQVNTTSENENGTNTPVLSRQLATSSPKLRKLFQSFHTSKAATHTHRGKKPLRLTTTVTIFPNSSLKLTLYRNTLRIDITSTKK